MLSARTIAKHVARCLEGNRKGKNHGLRKLATQRRMSLQNLERRELFAASLGWSSNWLNITADSGGSNVQIIDHNVNNVRGAADILQISLDGTWYTFAKQSVFGIRFEGSDQRDSFVAATGIHPFGFAIPQDINARGGDDYVVTGYGNDEIDGGYGNDVLSAGAGQDDVYGGGGDNEIHGGSGNDVLRGGPYRDRIWGDNGHDRIEGGSGYDDLYGGDGDDTLLGGNHPDLLEGGAGNDHMLGQSSNDFLYGGSGMDGLYGGSGTDYLHGGADPDRFLILTNESIADRITDDGTQDIQINFTNEAGLTINWGAEYAAASTTYSAGTWGDQDIEWIDSALGVMAESTGNNLLLYHADGSEPTLFRLGNASNQYIAFNDGVNTHYSNQSFQDSTGVRSEETTSEVIFHEFGHNWDTREEADSVVQLWGAAVIDVFRAESGWTQTKPADEWNFRKTGSWWYRRDADFVSWYAPTSPTEDFAETFAAYFMDQEGMEFREGVGGVTGGTGGVGDAPEKASLIGSLVWLASRGPDARPLGSASGSASASARAYSPTPMVRSEVPQLAATTLAMPSISRSVTARPVSAVSVSPIAPVAGKLVSVADATSSSARAAFFASLGQRSSGQNDADRMPSWLLEAADTLAVELLV